MTNREVYEQWAKTCGAMDEPGVAKYSSLDSAKVQQRGWFTRADDMARTVEGYNATSLRVLRQGYADLAQQFNGLMADIIGTEKTVQELRDKLAVQRGCYVSLTAHNDQLQKEAVLDRDEIQRLRAAVDAANAFVAERETDKDKTIQALQEQLRKVTVERDAYRGECGRSAETNMVAGIEIEQLREDRTKLLRIAADLADISGRV